MHRLTPHAQALIVPHSSGAGRFWPSLRVSPITPSVHRSARFGWMSPYPTVAYAHPRPRTSVTGSNAAFGGPFPAGNPKDRLSSTGTGRSAFAGVYTVRVIVGPPGFSPTRPTTRRITAAPPRAFGSV